MEFKIESKSLYTLIAPVGESMDEAMAASLGGKVKEEMEQGKSSFIIDLQRCTELEPTSSGSLLSLHKLVYNNGGSLVFTQLEDRVMQSMKKEQLHLSLNIAPTLLEAIDIISMEALERDLLNES